MTAALIRDDREWEYPGGVCRLLVWEDTTPGDSFVLAIVSQEEATRGLSTTTVMEDIVAMLAEQISPDVQVVQHIASGVHHELLDIGEPEPGQICWSATSAVQLADELGIDLDALLTLLED